MTARVVLLQETMPGYRVALIEAIQRESTHRGIRFEVVHGHAPGLRGERLNTGDLPGATIVRNRYLRAPGENGSLVWQPALAVCRGADMVIVEQASRLVINYALLLARRIGGPLVAYWGHGRNLQAETPSIAERIKASLIQSPDWWFAYTRSVGAFLKSRGVPDDRITVVGNTLDVSDLQAAVARARGDNAEARYLECTYLGGLYPLKRLDLLFDAADLVAAELPDFRLTIAGDGELRGLVEQYVAHRSFACYVGSVSGEDKAKLLASSRLLLIPGLVGLVVLDSFAAGVPIVTTAAALHSPEIEYLVNGVNGLIVQESNASGYARALIHLLTSTNTLLSMRSAALAAAAAHSIEGAAARFVDGVDAALGRDRAT